MVAEGWQKGGRRVADGGRWWQKYELAMEEKRNGLS